MRAEAQHTLDAFGLSFIINYLHSMATNSGATVPEEIKKRIENMEKQQAKIHIKLIQARAIDQFRSQDYSR